MVKLLVVAVALALLIGWIWGRGRSRSATRGRDEANRRATEPAAAAEAMIACAHCGVHLPRSQALLADGHAFCSPAHRDAGARDAR